MRQRYEAKMVAMELRVKQVLNAQGVHTTNYVPYVSYGRRLRKLVRQKQISGESSDMASAVPLQKWAARGQDPNVLAAIRQEACSAGEPAP